MSHYLGTQGGTPYSSSRPPCRETPTGAGRRGWGVFRCRMLLLLTQLPVVHLCTPCQAFFGPLWGTQLPWESRGACCRLEAQAQQLCSLNLGGGFGGKEWGDKNGGAVGGEGASGRALEPDNIKGTPSNRRGASECGSEPPLPVAPAPLQ